MKLDLIERVWTSRENSFLGTATDKEVGKLVGRHYLAVAERRHEFGSLPGGRTRKEWTLTEMRLLGSGHSIGFKELQAGHVLISNIETSDGMMIVTAGNKISPLLLQKLRNFAAISGIKEPIYVEA